MNLDCTGPRPRLDLDDPALRLTDAQRRAMAIDRELVVTAGAGAGKTFTLSLRYLALLLELASLSVQQDPHRPRPDIEAVLVLTFTEKAAGEMASRCYRRLLTLSASIRQGGSAYGALGDAYGPAYPTRLAAAIDHLVDHFDRARIGTFHGFCARVLTEFPSECETPTGFDVMDEADSVALLARCVDQTLFDAYRSDRTDVQGLIAALGTHRSLRDALMSALRNRDVLEPILARHRAGAVSFPELYDLLPISINQMHTWLKTKGQPSLQAILDAVAPTVGGAHLTKAIRPALDAASAALVDPTPAAIAHAYGLATRSVTTGKKLRSIAHSTFMGAKGSVWKGQPADAYTAAKERLLAIAEDLEDWPERSKIAEALPGPIDQAMLPALTTFAGLAHDATQLLVEQMKQARAVDFSAMQERAVTAVLTHAHLRAELCQRHRYLMVDEFQDTDERQWSMVRALGRPDDVPSDRIFIVGDAKQAIYRFRGGDVTVFRTATSDLGVQPLVFPDNFRSRTGLIDWFNHFFAALMGPASEHRPAYEAGYSTLTAGRGEPGGSVRWATYTPGQTAAESAVLEAQATARVIASQVLAGTHAYTELDAGNTTKHPTPPIAVLLQSRTRLADFEAAFRQHKIPFMVSKGAGFWSMPEVVDSVNLLHAIATDDPTSIVGVLRSPLFAVSDAELDRLHAGHWGEWTGFAAFATLELAPEAPPALHRAQATWRGLKAARDEHSVSALLAHALERTCAVHAFALRDGSGQTEANAQRLIELCSTLNERGLDEAVEFLRAQVDNDTREAQASIPPSSARVVIMTVHASKGLEFPVVVVPQCSRSLPSNTQPLRFGRLRGDWHIGTAALDPQSPVRTRASGGLVKLLGLTDRQESLAESIRMLYVSATRAEDHLILIGEAPKESADLMAPKTWTEMLASVFDPESSSPLLQICDAEAWAQLPTPTPAPAPGPGQPDADAAASLQLEPAPPQIEVSPSSLDRFSHNPADWYRRERLGIPDATPAAAATPLRLAGARGEVIHGLLEDDAAHDPDVAKARWRNRAAQEGATAAQIEESWPAVAQHLERASADPQVQERLMAPGMAEVRFRLAHAGVVLVGQIDRLFRDPSGRWVVLDWKSERVQGTCEEAAQRHSRQLMAYAWAADRILRAHGEAGVHRSEVYFTDRGELVALPNYTADDYRSFEVELERVGEFAALTWPQVQSLS
ncbi:MAG: UvrD-helicase domain-containing protein [Myxococcota bacterium]